MAAAVPRPTQAGAPQQPSQLPSVCKPPIPKPTRRGPPSRQSSTPKSPQPEQPSQQQQLQQPQNGNHRTAGLQYAAGFKREVSNRKAYAQAQAPFRTQPRNADAAQTRQTTGLDAEILGATTVWDVLELFLKRKQDFDTVNISTAFHRLAKVSA